MTTLEVLLLFGLIACGVAWLVQFGRREAAERDRDAARTERDDHKAAWQKASDERDELAQKLADGIRVLSGEGES